MSIHLPRLNTSFDTLTIDGFEWDEGNCEKCQKHGVSIHEIESLFKDGSLAVFFDKKHSRLEERLIAIGKTQNKSDKTAEDFIENSGLTEYDLSGAKPVQFEFQKKNKAVTLRIPEELLEEVKKTALHERMPYQRFIRMALEKAVHSAK